MEKERERKCVCVWKANQTLLFLLPLLYILSSRLVAFIILPYYFCISHTLSNTHNVFVNVIVISIFEYIYYVFYLPPKRVTVNSPYLSKHH